MNAANVHLILNHVTIVGIPIATIFLLHGILKGNLFSRRFALAVLIVLSAVVVPVYLTGEPAEETVEDLPGVVESMIETHEDAGKVSMVLTILLGVASLFALWFQKDDRKGKKAATIVLIFSLIPIASLVYTGSLGGKIRHTEIRPGDGSANGDGAATSNDETKEKNGEEEEED
ncbi:MAG: DUF2231 domain-containing protein [Bdellovibrio sp.]